MRSRRDWKSNMLKFRSLRRLGRESVGFCWKRALSRIEGMVLKLFEGDPHQNEQSQMGTSDKDGDF